MKTFIELTLLTLQRIHKYIQTTTPLLQLLLYFSLSLSLFSTTPSRLQAAKVPWLRPWRWWKIQCAWFCAWQYKGSIRLRSMQEHVISSCLPHNENFPQNQHNKQKRRRRTTTREKLTKQSAKFVPKKKLYIGYWENVSRFVFGPWPQREHEKKEVSLWLAFCM